MKKFTEFLITFMLTIGVASVADIFNMTGDATNWESI